MFLTLKKIFSTEIQKLRNYFFAGLLVVTPIGLTFWMAVGILNFFGNKFRWSFQAFFNVFYRQEEHAHLYAYAHKYDAYFPLFTYGFGFLLTILLISFVGMATQMYLGRKTLNLVEFILIKIPVISSVYNGLKQVSESIMGRRSKIFERVVIIEYPRKGLYSLAFITAKDKNLVEPILNKPVVYVFIATTPNPTSGIFLIVPEEELIPIDLSVEDGMKMIISSGMVVPKKDFPRLKI
ncbi:MAG: DUF502 domain-containing protein [Candidatus Omnitrophota bacterium]|jgi:uncharacterized membrane protein|nr:MAG: DUF502 domain-containing protein [Candidatus Omnitrophota bacterium]